MSLSAPAHQQDPAAQLPGCHIASDTGMQEHLFICFRSGNRCEFCQDGGRLGSMCFRMLLVPPVVVMLISRLLAVVVA